jgi:hypothetical protein
MILTLWEVVAVNFGVVGVELLQSDFVLEGNMNALFVLLDSVLLGTLRGDTLDAKELTDGQDITGDVGVQVLEFFDSLNK